MYQRLKYTVIFKKMSNDKLIAGRQQSHTWIFESAATLKVFYTSEAHQQSKH